MNIQTTIAFLLPIAVLAQDLEQAPTLNAVAILWPEFAVGVRELVPTYGG